MDAKSFLVVGAQFGDEGKGKVVDLLVERADIDVVVRYNGGANAGHTIVLDDGKYPLHLIPSGILHPQVTNVVAAGVVIEPQSLIEEINNLRSRGVSCDNLFISDRAHLVMPWHKRLDAHLGGKIGTTARGIGPCYEDRASRRGLRVGDLVDEHGKIDRDHFATRLREVGAEKNRLLTRLYELEPLDLEEVLEATFAAAEVFRHKVTDTADLIARLNKEGKGFMYEGAQGSLLDLDWGTYPFVTSSSVSMAGCHLGSGNFVLPELRLGVVKAYGTRVGEGPFPGELGTYEEIKTKDSVEPGTSLPELTEAEKQRAAAGDDYLMGSWIRRAGHEYGTTTGRPRRCGWLDMVAVRHAVRLSGLNGLALTKLDVLSHMPSLKICTGYRYQGQVLQSFPARAHHLDDCQPIYEEMEGFGSLEGVDTLEDLPAAALAYVRRVEELAGAPVKVLSVGQHRAQSMVLS